MRDIFKRAVLDEIQQNGADTGPILPLLSNLEAEHHGAVRSTAMELLEQERAASTTN